jgi:hypothetical protein
VPAEVLLAHVVCKTVVPPARKVGLYMLDLLHVLVVMCITRAPHTCPIRHRLLRFIDLFGWLSFDLVDNVVKHKISLPFILAIYKFCNMILYVMCGNSNRVNIYESTGWGIRGYSRSRS